MSVNINFRGINDRMSYDRRYQERLLVRRPYFAVLAKILIEKFNPSLCLDIGASDDLLIQQFKRLGVECYGIDICKEFMVYASEDTRGNLILADVEQGLPFKDCSFDLITILEVLEHLRKYDYVISEIKRVLKPGGIVFVTTPSKMQDAIADLFGIPSKLRKIFLKNHSYTYHPLYRGHKCHSKSFWIKKFTSQGFELVKKMDIKKQLLQLLQEVG